MVYFSHTTGSLYYDECMTVQLGVVKTSMLLSV